MSNSSERGRAGYTPGDVPSYTMSDGKANVKLTSRRLLAHSQSALCGRPVGIVVQPGTKSCTASRLAVCLPRSLADGFVLQMEQFYQADDTALKPMGCEMSFCQCLHAHEEHDFAYLRTCTSERYFDLHPPCRFVHASDTQARQPATLLWSTSILDTHRCTYLLLVIQLSWGMRLLGAWA